MKILNLRLKSFFVFFLFACSFFGQSYIALANDKTCLYVSSYHKGYEWSDGIEEGLVKSLQNACVLEKFYMDTKRNKGEDFKKKKGLEAKNLIDEKKPNVVIACDDNAQKYLVVPYYKDSKIPFVFCGVNHTVDAYGYPYSNVTGMIEIAPVKPLRDIIKNILGSVDKGVYLSMDITSQHKEYEMNKAYYLEDGIVLERILISNMDEWIEGFKKAQNYPFVIIGSSGGIEGWDIDKATEIVMEHSKTLTVTNMDWLYKVSMITATKIAEEQGEWSAEVAKAILEGATAQEIPIVVNKEWNLRINSKLLEKVGVNIPQSIRDKAIEEAQ